MVEVTKRKKIIKTITVIGGSFLYITNKIISVEAAKGMPMPF
jgi:hypothetical protein